MHDRSLITKYKIYSIEKHFVFHLFAILIA